MRHICQRFYFCGCIVPQLIASYFCSRVFYSFTAMFSPHCVQHTFFAITADVVDIANDVPVPRKSCARPVDMEEEAWKKELERRSIVTADRNSGSVRTSAEKLTAAAASAVQDPSSIFWWKPKEHHCAEECVVVERSLLR